jgi:hypothetical protein
VRALLIEAANALSADAGVTNSNAASSTSNLNILPPNPLRHLSHAAHLSIFVFTLDLDQQSGFREADPASDLSYEVSPHADLRPLSVIKCIATVYGVA